MSMRRRLPFINGPALRWEPYAEEYDFYLVRRHVLDKTLISENHSEESFVAMIDTIDKSLAGKFKILDFVREVFGIKKSDPKDPNRHKQFVSGWIKNAVIKGLSYVIPDGEVGHVSPPLNNDEERLKEGMKKGVYDEGSRSFKSPVLTGQTSYAIRHLAKVSALFFPKPHYSFLCHVGAFFVPKGDNKLRMIIDARFANILWQKMKFSFFTLECLRQVIDNLSGSNWYALNFDLRHWFHQIPLPGRYHKFFGIPMMDRKNDGDFCFVPAAMPMGWVHAPFVAQCITWSLILGRHDTTFPDVFDVDWKALRGYNEPPAWVPLKSGGGIFVLLDNILVVTPKKEVAEAWFNHITDMCERYHAVLKVNEKEQLAKGQSRQEALREQCFIAMEDASSSFDFLGVQWFRDRHRIEVDAEEKLSLPGLTADGWKGTRRDMASILGKLIWHRRVYDLRLFDGSEESEALRSIFGLITPSSDEGWNSPFSFPTASLPGLQSAWARRMAQSFALAKPLFGFPSVIIWAGVDAATNDSENGGKTAPDRVGKPTIAVVLFLERSRNYQTLLSKEKHKVHRRLFPVGEFIAIGELKAIHAVVELVDTPGALVIIATDSMTAKRWVESRKAHNDEALKILKQLYADLERKNLRLYLVYVPSAGNVSDRPTRFSDDLLEDEPMKITHRCLMTAENEALGLWMNAGARAGGVNRVREEDFQ